MESTDTDPVQIVESMDTDPVQNFESMDTEPVQNPCDQIPFVDPKDSNKVFAVDKLKMFVSAYGPVKLGAQVEFYDNLIKILGLPTPGFVLKDKHLVDVSEIVVVWHPQHGTFSGLLHSGRGIETVYNIITHTPTLLNATLVHVSFENLCGLKVFQTQTELSDCQERKIDVNDEVMPVSSSPRTECSGFVSHKDPDSRCLFIVSMDMNRAYRVVTADPSEILVITDSLPLMKQRKTDRKVLAETKNVVDSLLRLLTKVPLVPGDENFNKISSAVETNLMSIIKSRESVTASIQIDILAPFLRNFYSSAQILNNLFFEWISQTQCAQDPVLQQLLAASSTNAAASQTIPKTHPTGTRVPCFAHELEVTANDVLQPLGPEAAAAEAAYLSQIVDEDGFHRVLREMPKKARERERRNNPSFIALPRDNNYSNVSIAFQISDLFCNAPNERWTLREFRNYVAGDYVRVTDPKGNNRLYIVLCFAQKNGPNSNDPMGCFVELKCFSNEKPSYNIYENIDTIYIPAQRCVYTTADGQLIGPGDRCRRMMPENELLTVFVSAIADGLCIYAQVPKERKVHYDICPCSELIFVADGPPTKWNYDSVAYNTRVDKHHLEN